MGEPRLLQGGLNTGRAADVIKLATEKAGWGRKLPAGHGMGLAFHFSHAGHFAEVAEVSVDANKRIRLHRMVVVGDIGPIVNMSGANNQCEGGVIDGYSTMLGLEITMENGRVEQSNFHQYPILAHRAPAEGRSAFHPERQPAHGCRRTGIAAGGAGDLQCDLRGHRASRAHAAAHEGRLFGRLSGMS